MKNFSWKMIMPHAIAVGIFLIISLIYCKPVLEGKVLQQEDNVQWQAMSKDQKNVHDKTGEVPLWSNGMFSGMPGYLIMGRANNQLPYYFTQAISLGLPKPVNFFFLACICFYFLAQVLRTDSRVSIVGALGYAYATYNAVIVGVGHDTKMLSIALLPGFIGGLLLIYDKKYLIGVTLAALFASALISQNHYQIAYYGLLIALFMSIGYLVHWIMQKQWKHLFIAASLAAVAGLLGVLSNAVVIFPNYEYTKATIRGGSSLADDKSNETKTGLSNDYAFSYSLYKSEPLVMLVPHIFGGSDKLEVPEDKSKAIEALQSMPPQLGQQLQNNLRFYWGGIGNTQGPPYVGAIICFLAIIGFVVLDNKHKWWILAGTVISIVMSWGGFFPGFNGWLLDHLPMYNKFRAPSMIIVIPTLLLGMMATLSLDKILFHSTDKVLLWKEYKKGLMITGGIFVLLLLLYVSFDYTSDGDKQVLSQVSSIKDAQVLTSIHSFFNALKEDRQGLFLGDIMRSLFFILVAAAAIWAFIKNKLKPVAVTILIGIFSFVDVMAVDVNYLNGDNYKEAEQYQADNFVPAAADTQILQDKSFYRVLDLRNGLNGALTYGAKTAYFHKSIGGYHPAKLSIYQDLIEKQLSKFPNCLPVIDMLDTKYVITQDGKVQQNPDALGAAWFVKTVKFVKDAPAEMAALDTFNPKDTAVADASFKDVLKPGFTVDTTATISLLKNDNDVVTYKSKSASEQLAVFSEVYYDKGWNAYVDDKKTSYAKVDYVLRGMMVPAGEHTIVFKFEPASHALGWKLTSISSILLALLMLTCIVTVVKNNKSAKA